MSDKVLADRIEALESQVAFQERAIEELNTTITDQWKEIAALTRQIGQVGERLREIGDNPALAGAPEPPPPHY